MDGNEEEDKGKIAVLHQLAELPLYHIKYHIIISNNPILAKRHIEDLYPGIEISFTGTTLSYTCTIKHEDLGDANLVYVRVGKADDEQPIESIIAHEAVNLAWILTDELSIKIDTTNYVTQAFIVSDVVKNITKLIQEFEEENTGIGDL